MELQKIEAPKLPDIGARGCSSMCGDHPSFTKTELNMKETRADDKEKLREKQKQPTSYARISPSSSRTERGGSGTIAGGGERGNERGGTVFPSSGTSEHALRVMGARRRVRSLEVVQRSDVDAAPGNRALVQAALGSFRWPPYLLAVWVVVLVLTHVLHCVVTVLERSLPNIKKFCQYFRTWTEEAWRLERDINYRVYPVALAVLTGLLYCFYFGLYVLYSVALWSIEPLCSELDDTKSSIDVMETKVTNYIDECNSKTNTGIKH